MKHSVHQYSNYTMQQLLAAPYFLEWVRFPDATNTAFWEAYIAAYPNKATDVTKAAAIAKTMYVVNEQPLQSREVWNNIQKGIKPVRRISIIWKAAAAVLLLVIAATWITTSSKKEIEIASRFGEVKKLVLPDSSEVTLNGNSTIRYSKQWDTREVWIDGEAFFDIKHPDTRGFKVHSKGLDIDVLGTSFNIRNRRGITSVVLNTGKVLVAAADNKQLVLSRPGDMALYNNKDLTKKQVPVDHYTSWQQQKLQLDQVAVADFFEMLEDDWGYKIQLNDSSLLNKKISGEIDMKDKQVLMDALAVILNANVTQQGSTIIVTPN